MIIPQIKLSLSFDKKVKKSELTVLNSSKDAEEVFRQVFDADTFGWIESMILLCLNKASKVIGFYKVSTGGIDCTICDPRIVFSVALNCGATSIVVAHNHPSGNLTPSSADVAFTKRLEKAGEVMDIRLVDSMIITDEGYYSFADRGML